MRSSVILWAGKSCESECLLVHILYDAMNKTTKTKILIGESESAGSFEDNEAYCNSSDESASRPSSGLTCKDEDVCNENKVIIERLNVELARAKALSKARCVGNKGEET